MTDWNAKYKTHFRNMGLFSFAFVATDVAADHFQIVYWPARVLQVFTLFGALLSAAVAGHAAAVSKIDAK